MTSLTTFSLALALAAGGPGLVAGAGGAATSQIGPRLGSLAIAMQPNPDDENTRHVSLRDRALDAIRRHDFNDAEKLIREGRKTRSISKKDEWTIVESYLELERKNYAKAGLLAMQIVILREKSDEFARALFCAGRAYEGLGRPNKSIELYEECRRHQPAPESVVKAATQRLELLRKSDKPDEPDK